MHVVFNPDMVDWNVHLVQTGGGAYFVGVPYQRGAGIGSVFRSIFRFLMPMIKSAGKELGREGLATSARVLGNLAQGQDLRSSVVNETSEGLKNLIDRTQPQEALKTMITKAQSRLQKGSGKKRRQTRKPVSLSRRQPRRRSVPNKRLDALGFY